MNKTLNTLFGALLLVGSTSAFAASSVDLTVTGVITPSACTPGLANGGVVDFGKISAKDLNPNKETSLPRQLLQLTLTCDAPTLAALEAKDNREGSNWTIGQNVFGLGLINGDEKLGSLQLMVVYPVADGVPVRVISSEDDGSSWTANRYMARNNIVTVADTGTLVPKPVQLLTADISVMPEIAPTDRLTLTNEVSIDGSVTMTVRYL
ncbi:DUF1120 domain-containing protein [Pseudomonas baetica]|uniref:DUF1120 domain-containing protein n=1 Tax=Pseudomonas baetica TaxID=674054 RepID=UPI003EEEFB53